MTPARTITVTAGSRLHFGMFAFGRPEIQQFGGVGAMIDVPRVVVRIRRSEQLSASGPLHERALVAARRVIQSWGDPREVSCKIEVLQAPRPHTGLGTGTQLALAVAWGMHALFQRDGGAAEDLARTAGRGQRSAIGLHGFAQGGLLIEHGHRTPDDISRLTSRVELPTEWRWVLLCPNQAEGLSGSGEQEAFDRLPAVPPDVTGALLRESEHMLAAGARGDFDEFSRSLFRFGQLAGRCFQSQQAGIYATQELEQLVAAVRQQGIEGVGQSSWGPTLFALTRNVREAETLATWAASHGNLEITQARPLNVGATVHEED